MPITASRAIRTITAVTPAPANFSAFISIFQTGHDAESGRIRKDTADGLSLSRNGASLQRRQNILRPAAKLCDLCHTSTGVNLVPRLGLLGAIVREGITMSKQAEFAVILKMNPMFADLG